MAAKIGRWLTILEPGVPLMYKGSLVSAESIGPAGARRVLPANVRSDHSPDACGEQLPVAMGAYDFITRRLLLRTSARGLVPPVALFGVLVRLECELEETYITRAISSPIVPVAFAVLFNRAQQVSRAVFAGVALGRRAGSA